VGEGGRSAAEACVIVVVRLRLCLQYLGDAEVVSREMAKGKRRTRRL
jgi:hypothetical protein